VDLLDICWTCSYPLSCTLTLWQKICKSEQMTLISEFLFSTKKSTNSGSIIFQAPLSITNGRPIMFWHFISFRVFESRIACNRFPSRRRRRAALSIWHQLTQSIQKGESSFQEKCMDFHEIHPRVAYDLAHVCISWSVHTNKWRTTHNALCGYYIFEKSIIGHRQ
jgi:hypothetical protein